jgi:hypothetical protein
MDPDIWKNLPIELVRRIIEESEPTIDTKLAFKIGPKKLDDDRCWRLWYLLNSHDGLVYNLDTETLHNFRVKGHHIIQRPIKLDWIDDRLTSFNQSGHMHMSEVITPNGEFLSTQTSAPWMTEMRVLLKGSGLCRMLNVSDATF